jgi:hypothetical protein
MHSNILMSKNKYGFTPQTSTVDAGMALKDYVQDSNNDGQYVAVIRLDVKGDLTMLSGQGSWHP